MDEINTEQVDGTPPSDGGKTPAPSQKSKYTEKEKAEYVIKSTANRLKELGGDPAEILGIKQQFTVDEDLPDDKQLTVRDLRNIQRSDATKSAMQMADEIQDEEERETVKTILQTRIVPSGNAMEDLRLARAGVNAERNMRIVEEAERRRNPKLTASGSSQPGATEEDSSLTPEEEVFTRPPYNLSKEKILAKRPK